MRLLFLVSLTLGVFATAISAEEPKVTVRPITEADSVLAVYRKDHGLGSRGEPGLILAAWPDGHIVWSGDRLKGGAPYRAGRIDPKKVAALLERFKKEGLFSDETLNQAHFGPDSEFHTVFIKTGKQQVQMQSWHELFEESDNLVATERGVSALEGRRRLDVLRKATPEYLYFRAVWSETRSRLSGLVPAESTATAGQAVMKASELSWHEPEASKPGDPAK
jgi:hypothetical protein